MGTIFYHVAILAQKIFGDNFLSCGNFPKIFGDNFLSCCKKTFWEKILVIFSIMLKKIWGTIFYHFPQKFLAPKNFYVALFFTLSNEISSKLPSWRTLGSISEASGPRFWKVWVSFFEPPASFFNVWGVLH